MVIRGDERVAAVLARDERLVEVFASASPAFERLRSATLRRTMARLVTVEQAARVAGVEPALLLRRLNEAIDGAGPRDPGAAGPAPSVADAGPGGAGERGGGAPPDALLALPAERIVDLDVREDLRGGREPFQRIMASVRALPGDGVLRLRAPFEPGPLYHVLAKHGFAHWTEHLAAEDWRVWFYRAASPATPAAHAVGTQDAAAPHEDVVVLDVRGLEPPEPMLRTLAALEALPPGTSLLQLNVRPPQFLLPRLRELGFEFEIDDRAPDLVRVRIRRASRG